MLVTISFSASDRMDNVLKDHRYPAIGIGWLVHTLSEVIHHLICHPMVDFIPLSSFGCAVFDPLIALWFFAWAPSINTLLAQNRTHAHHEQGSLSGRPRPAALPYHRKVFAISVTQ